MQIFELSLDKKHSKAIEFIEKELDKISFINYNKEYSKNYVFYNIKAGSKYPAKIKFFDILKQTILTYYKLDYFMKKLTNVKSSNHIAFLISSLLFFDLDYENNVLSKEIYNLDKINIDGWLNFNIKSLLEHWDEVISTMQRLIGDYNDEQEIYDIADFICGTENKENYIEVINNNIYIDKEQKELINLFDNYEHNFIATIIKYKPIKVKVNNSDLPDVLTKFISYINKEPYINVEENYKFIENKTKKMKEEKIIYYDFKNKKVLNKGD